MKVFHDFQFAINNDLPTGSVGEKLSLKEIIKNKLSNEYFNIYVNLINTCFEDSYKKHKVKYLCLNISKNFFMKNFKATALYPILFGVGEWQKKIKEFLSNTTEESFLNKKKYFVESLRVFLNTTGTKYITSKNSLYDVYKMINWIDSLEANNLNSSLPKKENNFDLKTSRASLEELYNSLVDVNFIDSCKTTRKEFVNVFKLDWDGHKSIVYLEMDHPQTSLFFNQLRESLNIDIHLQKIERSQKFKNKSKKGFISASSLYSSVSRNKKNSQLPKQGELIIETIKSIKKVK